MPEFAANLLADVLVTCSLDDTELCFTRPGRRGCLPTRQSLTAGLGILMTQPMHIAQTRRLALPIVDVPLLDVGLVCWDQCPCARQAMCCVEHVALLCRGDGHRSLSTALGPRSLEGDVVAPIRVTGLELDRFLPTQSEGGL